MKKMLVLVLALAMLLSCACALADEPVTLTYSEVNPLEGNVVGEVAKAFKAKVEEISGGSVLIDIQAGGVLGSEDQILDNLLGGGNITDIGRFSAFALTQYGCDKAKLLSIPYTFVNEDHFWKFADSELAQEFLLEPQTLGLPLRGLCYGEEGFRHFFFKKGIEVKGIEDLKGLKIRVSADPVMTGMVENLGATATPVNFNELYSALNTGMVDADNKVAEFSEWEMNLLGGELGELAEISDIDMGDFGFADDGISADDFNDEFSLPDGEKSNITQWTLTFAEEQKAFIESALKEVGEPEETFGNVNESGNKIYEVVRQWVEQKKSN